MIPQTSLPLRTSRVSPLVVSKDTCGVRSRFTIGHEHKAHVPKFCPCDEPRKAVGAHCLSCLSAKLNTSRLSARLLTGKKSGTVRCGHKRHDKRARADSLR